MPGGIVFSLFFIVFFAHCYDLTLILLLIYLEPVTNESESVMNINVSAKSVAARDEEGKETLQAGESKTMGAAIKVAEE